MRISRAENLAVLSATALFTALFTYLAWRRQDAFQMGRFDLGNMSQAVWSSAHGRPLAVTDPAGNQVVRLALHVDPILVLLSPVYWVWADPKALLLLQAAVVSTGAFPLLWLARAELAEYGGRWLPVAFALTYLLYPPLQYATLDEFHPVTLAAPLLLFAIWYLRSKRYWAVAVFALLATATKEEVGLVVAALGLYAAFAWNERRVGSLLFGLGAAWSLIATEVVIPHFNNGAPGEIFSRYEAVGGSLSGVLRTAATDPLKILGTAFSWLKVGYLAALLAPLALLPLAAPFALLVATPELAANLLSSQEAQSSYHFHYVALLVPFIFWAGILGLKRLSPHLRAYVRALPVVLVGVALIAGWLMGPLPIWSKLPLGSRYKADTYSPDRHDQVVRDALQLIPKEASVSAGNQLGAHLSERRRILVFPQVDKADYIAVDELQPSYGEARGSPDQAFAVLALREDRRYKLVFSRDGVLVFRAYPYRDRP